MRRYWIALVTLSLLAQQEAPPAGQPSPAPGVEQWFTGSFEVGERFLGPLRGNTDAYRSVVNLGEGPKLFEADLTIRNQSRKAFDRLTVRGHSWGGEPYNTARVELEREGSYRFGVEYRNLAYFNALPSFANPFLEQGILFNQRAFDIQRRTLDALLELRPGSRIVPYLAFLRDWGAGSGVTDFVAAGNEYAVRNDLSDRTTHLRGGVRFELRRFHLTLEQGGSKFKDHQRAFHAGTHFGNRTAPLAGQRLFLSSLEQSWRAEGDSLYTKGLLSTNLASWVDLYGQFLYSIPSSDVSYDQANRGLFREPFDILFFTAQQRILTAATNQPHTSGSFGAEVRPHRRLRIRESWMTDRFHIAGAVRSERNILRADSAEIAGAVPDPVPERLILNYHRQEVSLLFDPVSWLTLRGGHRYVWGDAAFRRPRLTVSAGAQSGELKMHVGLAGLVVRPSTRLNISFDFEGSSAERNYFRTSLQDYQRVRIRGRWQAFGSLAFAANVALLRNENPAPDIRFDFLSRENSLSAFWTPQGGKWLALTGDYTRSTLRSNLLIRNPTDLGREQSAYRENAHIATAVLDLNFPQVRQAAPKLSAGGSLFVSSGNRASEYYRPLVRFSFPLHRKAHWFFEWSWYSLWERFYIFEGFRTHHYLTGLRFAL
ncbi:MAG: hypothetical protein RMK57_08515 [Bryobacterales bacterium]|nr:hypothetical protein [Bryobacteraceae bacterium]MDW8354559.1 hypothetical protein [Bryobacterales bacterium]